MLTVPRSLSLTPGVFTRAMDKKKSILLRINSDLSDELNRWAQDDLRSLNAQIEYILREEVRKRRRKLKSGGE